MGVIHDRSLLKTLMKPMVLLFALSNFGLFCGLASLFSWLPQIIKTFGLPNSQVGMVTAIPPLAGLIGMFLLSRHSDRLGERFIYSCCTLLAGGDRLRHRRVRAESNADHHRVYGRERRGIRDPGGVLDDPAIVPLARQRSRRNWSDRNGWQYRRRTCSGCDWPHQGLRRAASPVASSSYPRHSSSRQAASWLHEHS